MSVESSYLEAAPNRRILIVDDNPSIHEDFKKILCPRTAGAADLLAMENLLFGSGPGAASSEKTAGGPFELTSAFQGQEALKKVSTACAEGLPFAMAMVDVRMPPGWDGIETSRRLWEVDPELQIVICTAYSDYSWDEMISQLGHTDRLLILKKPFDPAEAQQLAHALTEKWRLQRSARLKVEQLESEVTKRTKDLKKAKDIAEQASRYKSAFLANMSHEIRTPMNGVLGMCQLLLDSDLSPSQRDLAETLGASGETLLAILNDILDFSKIEAGHMSLDPVPFSVQDVIENIVQLLARQAMDKQIELVAEIDPDMPARLIGDGTRLRQVLLNLLSNAMKFTTFGEVVIGARVVNLTPQQAGLQFYVRDTGIGMSPETCDRLFTPFTQADSSISRRYGGTGLGLAISQRLVDLMGGAIRIDSREGRGSTFWFDLTLPCVAEEVSKPVPTADLHGIRTLVVDDNQTNRKLLGHYLRAWGAPFVCASSGPEALQLIKAHAAQGAPFEMALLDLQMPVMDGIVLADEIRKLALPQAPQMVLLTSLGDHFDTAFRASHGLAGCLCKPLRKQPLYQCLLDVHHIRRPPAVTVSVREEPQLIEDPNRPRVLVAEDNAVNQKVAVLSVEQLGYAVDVVTDGAGAVIAAETGRYAVILMDIQMPDMDGIEATARIRQHESTLADGRRVPIIAMTANALAGDRETCLRAGMDDYISKPVRKNDLRAVLERHLDPEKSNRSLHESPSATPSPA